MRTRLIFGAFGNRCESRKCLMFASHRGRIGAAYPSRQDSYDHYLFYSVIFGFFTIGTNILNDISQESVHVFPLPYDRICRPKASRLLLLTCLVWSFRLLWWLRIAPWLGDVSHDSYPTGVTCDFCKEAKWWYHDYIFRHFSFIFPAVQASLINVCDQSMHASFPRFTILSVTRGRIERATVTKAHCGDKKKMVSR